VFEIAATLGWESLKHSLRREQKATLWLASVGHFLMGAVAGLASVLILDQRLTPRAPIPGLSLILVPLATGAVMRWLGGAVFAFGMALVRLIVFRTPH
jgi:hypothetical protein